MPPFPYWITGTALYLAGSFVFIIIVGLIGIRDDVPRKLFSVLFVAAFMVSVLAWHQAAKQEYNGTEQARRADALQDDLKQIADAVKIDPNTGVESLPDAILNKVRYRTIDPAVAVQLIADLKASPPQTVFIWAIRNELEPRSYAEQWQKLLRDGGWNAFGVTTKLNSPTVYGLYIAFRSGDHIPPGANELFLILKKHQIAVTGAIEQTLTDDDQFILFIGDKPPQ